MKWSAEITSLPSVSVILKVLFLLPHHCSLRPPCHPHKLAVLPSPGTLGCWSVPGASSTKVPQGLCRCAAQALPSLTAAWLCRACCVCSTIREMGDGTVYQIPSAHSDRAPGRCPPVAPKGLSPGAAVPGGCTSPAFGSEIQFYIPKKACWRELGRGCPSIASLADISWVPPLPKGDPLSAEAGHSPLCSSEEKKMKVVTDG